MRKPMKLLLAVDGSESGLAVVEETARTPWPEGSKVRIVSVAEASFSTERSPGSSNGSSAELERASEERCLENATRALARFGEIDGAHTDASAKILRGEPTSALLDEAEHWGADLIILGSHDYNVFERLWLGSVSRDIMSNAKCSVEIARNPKSHT